MKLTNTHKHFIGGAMICFAISILTAIIYPSINKEILYWVAWSLAFLMGIIWFECWQHDKCSWKYAKLLDSIIDVLAGLVGWFGMLAVSLLWNKGLYLALSNL